jgi:hypothetical protein
MNDRTLRRSNCQKIEAGWRIFHRHRKIVIDGESCVGFNKGIDVYGVLVKDDFGNEFPGPIACVTAIICGESRIRIAQ